MRRVFVTFMLLVLASLLRLAVAQVTLNMPELGDIRVYTCNAWIYDNGGASGNYSDDCDGYMVIYPVPGNYVMISEGTYDTELYFDTVFIYDGAGVNSTPVATLAGHNGTLSAPIISNALNGALTIRFKSDYSLNYDGFALHVQCIAQTVMSNSPISGCSIVWSDPVGTAGYNNQDLTQTICSNNGEQLIVNFDQFSLAFGDSLYVYDGNSPAASMIGVYSGSSAPPNMVSSSNCLTFHFARNSTDLNSGWLAYISCKTCTPASTSSGSPCIVENIHPFCTEANSGQYEYNSGTTGDADAFFGITSGYLGCIGIAYAPAWYFMRIDNPGDITIHIAQVSSTGSALDVDFACWGPFAASSSAEFMENLCCGYYSFHTARHNSNTGFTNDTYDLYSDDDHDYPYGNLVDCSYDTATTEDCHITNARAGEYYLLMITNYDGYYTGASGIITFNTTTGSTATTDCSLMAEVSNDGPYCVGDTIHLFCSNPQSGASYLWTGPDGWSSQEMNPVIYPATLEMDGNAYTLVKTVGDNSSDPATTIISVSEVVASITASPSNAVCEGDVVTLVAESNCIGGSVLSEDFGCLAALCDTCDDINYTNPGGPGSGQLELSQAAFASVLPTFPTRQNAYPAGDAIKLGKGLHGDVTAAVGSITSVPLDLSYPFAINLSTKGWGRSRGKIVVSVDGAHAQSFITSNDAWPGTYTTTTLYFPAATSQSTITIRTDTILPNSGNITEGYRCFIDNVTIDRQCYYQWSTDNGDTHSTVSVSPTESGSYTVTVTNGYGCSATASYDISVNHPQGTHEIVLSTGSYTWNGNTYSNSGIYYYAHIDDNGCTQVDTLDLTIEQISEECVSWQLVTDVSQLSIGDSIVITNFPATQALSTVQNNNNRGAIQITSSGNTVDINNSVQIIVLEQGAVSNSYAFHVNTGYLYAASSTNNYLRTQPNINNNSSWQININAGGSASIVAQGTSAHNNLRYNNAFSFFSCYSGTTQQDVAIYKYQRLFTQSETYVTVCSSYNWNDLVLTESGVYDTVLTNAANCDSIVILHLTVLHEDPATVSFNPGNGTCAYTSLTEEDCQSGITLPTATPCSPTYTFAGWSTAPVNPLVTTLPTPLYQPGEQYFAADDVTLYAVYKRCSMVGEYKYVKVTEEPADWSGAYLIAYRDGSLIFDGSLAVLDAVNNYQSVTTNGDTILNVPDLSPYSFAISSTGAGAYTIRSNSGYYIGNTADINAMNSSTTQPYSNTLHYNNGNVDIIGSGGAYLRFNSTNGQMRFRYYKSNAYTEQKAIQLYRYQNVSLEEDCQWTSNPSCQASIAVTSYDPEGACNPEIIAPNFVVTDNCSENPQAIVNEGAVVSTSLCGRSRTWTASYTDPCGNEAAPISITYTWKEDHEPPTVGSLPDLIVEGCDTLVKPAAYNDVSALNAAGAGISDECGEVAIISVTDAQPTGTCPLTVVRTYTIADLCGNENTISQNIIIQIPDFFTIAPVDSMDTVACFSMALADNITLPEVRDACGLVLQPSSDSPFISGSDDSCEGLVKYTYMYLNCRGDTLKWTYTYVVADTTPPAFIVPSDIAICRDTNGIYNDDPTVTGVPMQISDNCSSVQEIHCSCSNTLVSGTNGVDTLLRQWIVEDNCDNVNVQTQRITIMPVRYATVVDSICEGEVYDALNFNFVAKVDTIVYQIVPSTETGCDSVTTLNLKVHHPVNESDSVTAIDEYMWNGSTYAQSGTYTYLHPDIHGCDQVDTLFLTIHYTSFTEKYDTVCDRYTWDGVDYTESGVFIRHFTNVFNADSIVTLHLTVNHSKSKTIYATACDTYEWNDMVYTETGVYEHNYQTSDGCDSLVTLELTLNDNQETIIHESACDEFTWFGSTYTESGIYVETLESSELCDSTVILYLTINHDVGSEWRDTVCNVKQWNDEIYTESGEYVQHFESVLGCDSAVTLHLVVNHSDTTAFDATGCNTFTWENMDYAQSGNYTRVFTNQFGCDSVVTMRLTINSTTSSTQYDTIVENHLPYDTLDMHFADAGILSDTIVNVNGCDSIVTMHLYVWHNVSNTIDSTVCEDDMPVVWNDVVFESEGENSIVLVGDHGVDSLLTMRLTVNPKDVSVYQDDVCEGSDYFGYGFVIPGDQTVHVPGHHLSVENTFENEHGCDSIVRLELDIMDTSVFIRPLSDFCENPYTTLTVFTQLTDYLWSTGETSPTIDVMEPGVYSVSASQGDCRGEAFIEVPSCTTVLRLPNAISPNNRDGLNDCLCIPEYFWEKIESFEIAIFNRWGQLVFYSEDKCFKWYGEYDGDVYKQNVYSYKIGYYENDRFHNRIKIKGSIVVL